MISGDQLAMLHHRAVEHVERLRELRSDIRAVEILLAHNGADENERDRLSKQLEWLRWWYAVDSGRLP